MSLTDDGVKMIDGVPLTAKAVAGPRPEVANSVEEERVVRKQKLAGALRIFGRFGFGEGVAGHITVRDPEFPDHFWVNPFGMSFRHVRVSDLILVNHDGEVVYGSHPVNRAAFVLHSAIHQARPDVVSAAHAHSVYGKAWSSLGRPLDPITQDACAFYEDHVVIADEGGAVVFEVEAGKSYFWCACGRSATQPFCDGAHKGTGIAPVKYTATASKAVYFCTCKATKKAPLCDGSHKQGA